MTAMALLREKRQVMTERNDVFLCTARSGDMRSLGAESMLEADRYRCQNIFNPKCKQILSGITQKRCHLRFLMHLIN